MFLLPLLLRINGQHLRQYNVRHRYILHETRVMVDSHENISSSARATQGCQHEAASLERSQTIMIFRPIIANKSANSTMTASTNIYHIYSLDYCVLHRQSEGTAGDRCEIIGPRGPRSMNAVVRSGSEVPSLPYRAFYTKLHTPFLQESTWELVSMFLGETNLGHPRRNLIPLVDHTEFYRIPLRRNSIAF